MNTANNLKSIYLCVIALCACQEDINPCDQPTAGNFDIDHLVEIDLAIDPDDWDTVRNHRRDFATEFIGDCMSQPFESDYPTRPAHLRVDGQFIHSVGVRKKGFIGSQSDEKPSLKINIDEYIEDVKLNCTDNMTLNNGIQGPSVLRQCLAYAMFDTAGVIAPRCNFARLRVNENDLGIYAQVEPIKPLFMRRRFGEDTGDHYEGTLSDFSIDRMFTFDPKTDETDTQYRPLQAIVELLQNPDDAQFEAELRDVIQLKSFYRFWAMEVLTGHWDGYNGNRNNFHIYIDSTDNKITFIPWGLDDTFDVALLDETQLYSQSLLAQRILRIPSMKAEAYAELLEILDTVWNEDAMLARLQSMADLLEGQMDPLILDTEVEASQTFIIERRQQVLDMLEQTVVETEEDPPYCLEDKGFVEATFETTWGSNSSDDLLGSGSIQMTMDYDGDVYFTNTGVIAGPYEEDESYDVLIIRGELNPSNSAMLIPYINYASELSSTDSVIDIDTVFGRIYYTDNSGYFYEIATLHGGSLQWDNMTGIEGETVSGVLSSRIYAWEPVY